MVEIYTYASLEAKEQIKTKTTAATEEALGLAPATVYSITAADIENRGYNSLNELLADVPEFQIQQYYSGEENNLVSARGIFGNEKLLILVNGHRYNSMNSSKYTIMENYNIRFADRVEVVIGPASALYGADAYMGVVNIITKKGNQVKGVGVATEYGMFNTTQTTFEAGWGNDEMSFGIQGSYFQTDGANLPDLYPTDFDWYNRVYSQTGQVITSPLDPGGTTQLPIEPFYFGRRAFHSGLQFKYKGFSAHVNLNLETHSSSSGTRPEYSPYMKASLLGTSFGNINLEQRYFQKNKKLSAKTTLDISAYLLNTHSKFFNTFSGYQDAYKASTDLGSRLTQFFTYQFTPNHQVTAGLYFQYGSNLPQTSDLPRRPGFIFNPIIPVNTAELDLYYLGTNFEDEDGNTLKIYQNFYYLRRIGTGGFVEYKGNFGKRWYLTAGMRYDQIFDISEYSPRKTVRSYFAVSPRAGLVYTPIKGLVTKFFVGRGFLQPPPERKYDHFGLFYPGTNANGNYDRIEGGFWRLPNQDLLPEYTNSFELSVRYSKGDFTAGINGYYNSIFNNWTLAIDDDNPTFLGIPIELAERTVNSADPIFSYGTTVQGAYNNVWGAQEQYRFQMNLSYSYADGFTEGLEYMPFTATHMAKMGITFKIHGLTWYNSLLFRSNTYGQLATSNGLTFQNVAPAYFLWNTFIRYQVLKKEKLQLSVFAKVRNVLNARYYNVTENALVALGASPQDPILVTGGVVVHFGRSQAHHAQ